jgi:hypothetical protein
MYISIYVCVYVLRPRLISLTFPRRQRLREEEQKAQGSAGSQGKPAVPLKTGRLSKKEAGW